MDTVRFINTLPEELVTKILLFCHYADILRFSMTCKAYYKSVVCSSILQLQIELQSNGFQISDNPFREGAEGTAARLLEEFRRYRDGWLYLKLGEPMPLDQAGEDMRLYELRQGYYAAALSSTQELPRIVKLVDLSDKSTRLLSLGLHFSEFQIDPSQGLMVLVALEDHISEISTIHLRSFNKGNKHSEARYPDWKVGLPFYMHQRNAGIFVEVMDDLLAVKYVSYEKNAAEILIWNWRLGTLFNRIQCSGTSWTFGFLTSNSLMLFHSNTPQDDSAVRLSIYTDIRTPISSEKDEPPIYTTSKYKTMTPRFELYFPTSPSSSTIFLLLRAEPAPTITSSSSAPFVPHTSTRVIQLGMTVFQNRGLGRALCYQIFVSKEKLLQHLVLPDPESGQEESPIKIPWESWGEYTTRWFATASAVSPWFVGRTEHGSSVLVRSTVRTRMPSHWNAFQYLTSIRALSGDSPPFRAIKIRPCGTPLRRGVISTSPAPLKIYYMSPTRSDTHKLLRIHLIEYSSTLLMKTFHPLHHLTKTPLLRAYPIEW